MIRKKCLVIPKPNAKAKIRLICLPYAGGSARVFFPWLESLSKNIELVAVQMPGRSERMAHKAHTDMTAMAQELYEVMPDLFDKPFCLFGHSLGSKLAFELALMLQSRNTNLPEHIFLSGSRPPHLPDKEEKIHDLPYEEFWKEVEALNGTPKIVFENEEMMQCLTPLLRADFKVAETYQFKNGPMISSNVSILGGRKDADVPEIDIRRWGELFNGNAQVRMFDGGHFFIEENQDEVVTYINRVVNDNVPMKA